MLERRHGIRYFIAETCRYSSRILSSKCSATENRTALRNASFELSIVTSCSSLLHCRNYITCTQVHEVLFHIAEVQSLLNSATCIFFLLLIFYRWYFQHFKNSVLQKKNSNSVTRFDKIARVCCAYLKLSDSQNLTKTKLHHEASNRSSTCALCLQCKRPA